jgi:hypothetical protein
MSANLEAPRVLGLAPNNPSGAMDRTMESTATNHSGEDAALEEARAART